LIARRGFDAARGLPLIGLVRRAQGAPLIEREAIGGVRSFGVEASDRGRFRGAAHFVVDHVGLELRRDRFGQRARRGVPLAVDDGEPALRLVEDGDAEPLGLFTRERREALCAAVAALRSAADEVRFDRSDDAIERESRLVTNVDRSDVVTHGRGVSKNLRIDGLCCEPANSTRV
jgi:hypothetical protein